MKATPKTVLSSTIEDARAAFGEGVRVADVNGKGKLVEVVEEMKEND